MKLLIDIDEQSDKGKLTIGFLKEMGFDAKQMPSAADYAFPSDKKIDNQVLNYLLDEAEV